MGPTEGTGSSSPSAISIGYSRAVRNGNHLIISGTAPLGENGKTVGVGDIYQQTCRCIELAKETLAKAGADLDDVVRTKVLLTSMISREDAARAHAKFFKHIRPASSFVQVDGFIDPDWLVEVEMDALISPQH